MRIASTSALSLVLLLCFAFVPIQALHAQRLDPGFGVNGRVLIRFDDIIPDADADAVVLLVQQFALPTGHALRHRQLERADAAGARDQQHRLVRAVRHGAVRDGSEDALAHPAAPSHAQQRHVTAHGRPHQQRGGVHAIQDEA